MNPSREAAKFERLQNVRKNVGKKKVINEKQKQMMENKKNAKSPVYDD
jgi:hypothetical protein